MSGSVHVQGTRSSQTGSMKATLPPEVPKDEVFQGFYQTGSRSLWSTQSLCSLFTSSFACYRFPVFFVLNQRIRQFLIVMKWKYTSHIKSDLRWSVWTCRTPVSEWASSVKWRSHQWCLSTLSRLRFYQGVRKATQRVGRFTTILSDQSAVFTCLRHVFVLL